MLFCSGVWQHKQFYAVDSKTNIQIPSQWEFFFYTKSQIAFFTKGKKCVEYQIPLI
jgi:hypothetical protein